MRILKIGLIASIVIVNVFNSSSQVPSHGLIGFYPFNQNANDESGSGNNGNVVGPVLTTDRCGNPNSAYLFDGINDYIELDPSYMTPYSKGTFAAWVNLSSLNKVQYLGCIGDYDTQDYYISLIRFDPDYGCFSIFRRQPLYADIIMGSTIINQNQWYFVVLTSDGNQWNLYVNGIKETLSVINGNNDGDWAIDIVGVDNWFLGCIKLPEPYDRAFLNGKLDDIRIYDYPLTQEEISDLYYYDCENPNPVAFYPFSGNANDESGFGNHGIIHGAVLTTDRCEVPNSAYYFNGYSDYIQLPSSAAINSDKNFSISAWFCNYSITTDGKYTDNAIFGQTDGTYSSDFPIILIHIENDNTVRGAIRGTDYPSLEVRTDDPVQNNAWYHVVLVRNASKDSLALYLNGELVEKSSGILVGNTSSNDFVSIGAYFDDLQSIYHYFHGKIDDVMIFDRSLSNSEIRELYRYDCPSNTDTLTDIDGNNYSTVEICGQIWMAENLKTTRYNDGTSIPLITDRSDWIYRTSPGMCTYNFTEDTDFIEQYGRLYNWYTVNTGKLCPAGYHVPSDEEWKRLEKCLCMSQQERDRIGPRGTIQGSKIAGNNTLWTNGELESNDNFGEAGFNALPAGFISAEGIFWDLREGARFWTSSENDYSEAILRYLNHDESTLGRDISSKSHGRSIRCISSAAPGDPNLNECYGVLISGESVVCTGKENVIYEAISDAEITEYTWHYSGDGVTINGNSNPVILSFSETATSGTLSVTVKGDLIDASSDLTIIMKACEDTTNHPADFLNIPNSFSPNGDGVNDFFYIKGLPDNSTLVIFDRNGKKLFESDNYNNDWNGNDSQGHQLDSGTYWFIVTLPGFPDSFKGFLYLKR